ncbi:calcium-activated chloride channel regulator 1-like isoform X2 [Hemibagrus wyckioides]|uniref:calcium-activated chloride channel regulator 1-like isoform X2 n=1 Tax=Hemibagrus wyckioides TaxID=337641 RepID=UPI00266C4293|nr:calcium-activated chloride channel regulator 1-like isoform X2 [Hemibagrus wyckioides]
MLAVVLLFLSGLGPVTAIRLDGNGYTDILTVISPSVPENDDIINQIKGMIISGSEYLFEALDHKLYFKEVKILVPPNWTTGKYERATTETFDKGRIRIDDANSAFGDAPYTHQVTGCGTEAEYIHFTPKYLLDKNLCKIVYGHKGRVFVHEWAHLRWGVFDEYNNKEAFYLSAGQNESFESTRCSDKISGKTLEVINNTTQPCRTDETGLPTSSCKFYPEINQNTNVSIMYSPSMSSVKAFCNEEEHNAEAPNEQNSKCKKATRTVIFQESVDKDALRNLKPLPSPPPAPTFRVLQRGRRAVCLVLDVSGSMTGSRIVQQRQSASVFINQWIQEQHFVALVTFSTNAKVLSTLTLIDGQATRDRLKNMLPTTANGETYICKGLREALKVLQNDDDQTTGDEIIFLTDGEATDNVQECLQEAVQSGAIIHTISFGPNADSVLTTMADQTGGKFFVVPDSEYSHKLVDVFSSMTMFDGNPMTQPIQLESTGKEVAGWFNGTVTIDRTVGNQTTFTVTYETSAPTVYLQSPNGSVYDQRITSNIANTITLTIPGTAETGDWKYMFFSEGTAAQAISLIAISQAAHEDVYPVTVTIRTIQQTSDGTKPLVVLAEVTQNYNPVLGTSVWATLESDKGQSVRLQLYDNGAGSDYFKGDGTYCRYLTKLLQGKYSLKVRAEQNQTEVQLPPYRHSGALYIPGYIDDGEVKLNPPEPPVNLQPVDVGSFTRTVTGQSFVVKNDISINFPPNKITDLIAKLQEDTVLLSWTAPGGDYDLGRVFAHPSK